MGSKRAFAVLLAIQLLLALAWVVYAIYLPSLAKSAGIAAKWVPWILALDQAIFVATDWAAGAAAGRAVAGLRRIAPILVGTTLISTIAFALLPIVAATESTTTFLVLIILWTLSTAALRAPPLVLLSNYAPRAARPWLASMCTVGIGLAAALAPALATWLRGYDARLPFVFASVAVMIAALALFGAERASRDRPKPPAADEAKTIGPGWGPAVIVLLVLFSLAEQLHVALNMPAMYTRFVAPERLSQLVPLFWLGFVFTTLVAAPIRDMFGPGALMAIGAVIGTLALGLTFVAPNLESMIAIQMLMGFAWGCALMGAFYVAMGAAAPVRARAIGIVFAILAIGAMLRLVVVGSGWLADAAFKARLPSVATLIWAIAMLGTIAFVYRRRVNP